MRYTDSQNLSVQDRAAALLKAAKLVMIGKDFLAALDQIGGDAMAKGHAFRALAVAIGNTPPVLWQRRASSVAVFATIDRAVAFSAKPRHEHPGVIEQGESGEKWIIARRLPGLHHKTNKEIALAMSAKKRR